MLYNLKGKTAWITGGKRIGQKIAEVLAMHGADVVVSYKNSRKEAENLVSSLVKPAGAVGLPCDVRKKEEVESTVEKILEKEDRRRAS